MKDNTQTNILYLAAAGLVLILVNAAVVMGARSGQIAPVNNMMLWGSFAALNVCSLLWAVSMLGLQPLVMAASYAAGGLLAFLGVRSLPELSVAEISSTGAVFSAFGAMLVCNAVAKTRHAFFSKKQGPYVYVIVALSLLNGLLISRISDAGWSVIYKAAVVPFLFSGVAVGAVWMVTARCLAGCKRTAGQRIEEQVQEAEADQPIVCAAVEKEESGGLLFTVPDESEFPESIEEPLPESETELPEAEEPERKLQEAVSAESAAAEDESLMEDFFPLEIDNGDDVEVQENPDLLGVAVMVAGSAPMPLDADEPLDEAELIDEAEPIDEAELIENAESVADDPLLSFPEVTSLRDADSEPDEEPVNQTIEEEKGGSEDWLNSHLNLLDKLGK